MLLTGLMITLVALNRLAWMLFYSLGCPHPWQWVILGASAAVFVPLSRVKYPVSTLASFVTVAVAIFNVVTWVKGWPRDLVETLFWLTAGTVPMGVIDSIVVASGREVR